MFYTPAEGHGLPHNPLNAIVTPRPIGWISTRGADGSENLAPYSFFNLVAYVPPQVMFASTGRKPDREEGKDTLSNIRETGVFCVNITGEAQLDAVSASSAAFGREVDEFAATGVAREDCVTIPCSRVVGTPATLECRMTEIVALRGQNNFLVLGEVTGIHLNDACLIDGRFSPEVFHPLARMGYRDYAVVREVFEKLRPGES